MNQTDTFIAHGLLPLAGRKEEMAKILDFWQSVSEAQHLRVLLLLAEAGMGKSRLLEECLTVIQAEHGAVVHVKLYPGAPNALPSMVSRSMWNSSAGRAILREQPREELPSVIAALQRLCRLRPTLLVLEDVHLFPSESIPDLIRFFDGLMDETISVLCLSRPISFAAQSILERHLVESVTMEGLAPEDLEELWQKLFDADPPKGVIPALHAATLGNGLAVRSALRGALQNQLIVRTGRSGTWRINGTVGDFADSLQRSVSLIVEGMLAQLGRETRDAVAGLAVLGEVFSREAALALDPEIRDVLEQMVEQGLVVETFHPVVPLAGTPDLRPGQESLGSLPVSSRPLLAFTHSLLHDYLGNHAEVTMRQLLRVIGEENPLYSLFPLRLLETLPFSDEGDSSLIQPVMLRMTAVMKALDRTPEWRSGRELVAPLIRLLEKLEDDPDLDQHEKKRWRVRAQHYILSSLRRSMNHPDWLARHDNQLALTADPQDLEEVRFWMLTRCLLISRIMVDQEFDVCRTVLDQVDELVGKFPDLRKDVTYIYILQSIVQSVFGHRDPELMKRMQELTRQLLDMPDLPERSREMLCVRILPNFLPVFGSPEELAEREQSIPRIEEFIEETNPYYGLDKLHFLMLTGRHREALDLGNVAIRNARDQGMWINVFVMLGRRLVCAAGAGYTLQDILDEFQEMKASVGSDLRHPVFEQSGATALITAGIFLNRPDQILETVGALGFSFDGLPTVSRSVVALLREDVGPLRDADRANLVSHVYPAVHAVRIWKDAVEDWTTGTAEERDRVLTGLKELSGRPILHIFDVLSGTMTLRVWRGLSGEEPTGALAEQIVSATCAGLSWLHDRQIGAFMIPLVETLEELGADAEAAEWRKRAGALPLHGPGEAVDDPDTTARIRISMLGAVRVAVPPEDFAPVRGVRIRTLLGAMVADRMMERPLDAEEFLAVVCGNESDPEHARKKKNMAVVRLREIIGHDAILTDGPTPQLNMDLVSVDLLELDDVIRRAMEAVREGALVRALPLMESGLETYSGEVPFPTFYDDFFEALRSDFEFRLRQVVLELGNSILTTGDAAGAEPILSKAFELLPGDGEIGDLLRRIFQISGKRTEAERVRMKMESASE